MELVYLWVEEYKNIKQQGFNFSPNFECEFKPVYDDGELTNESELIINKKENPLKDFFGKNINVTAIVGENGAGKSSILEILANKFNPNEFKSFIMVYLRKGILTDTDTLNFIGITSNKHEESIYTKSLIEEKRLKVTKVPISKLHASKSVYFSNILNENDLKLSPCYNGAHYCNSVNISISHILNQMKLIETKIEGFENQTITGFDKVYRSYRIQQIQNAIILVKDKASKIPFKLPQKLIIRNVSFETLWENIKEKIDEDKYHEILRIIKNNSNEVIFKNYLSVNLIITFLLENIDREEIFSQIIDRVLNIKLSSSLSDFYEEVKKKVLLPYDFQDDKISPEPIKNFFTFADDILKNLNKYSSNTFDAYTLELDIGNTNFDFLESYEKLIQNSEYFLDISWRGISSGEENYLYQFSRFYELKNSFKKNTYKSLYLSEGEFASSAFFLIDEGELTLHPQWQKEYISYLVEFFKNNFPIDIHLIITTHSPFLLSDLPKENIIFLEKEEETGQCINATKKINISPFGANIHTLLSHGFFMKKGLMGEFAKSRIEEVIKFLNDEGDLKSLEEKDLKAFINVIGEDFLKSKLLNMYYKKYKDKKELRKKELIRSRDAIDKELSQYD